jgi:hypothetical protein
MLFLAVFCGFLAEYQLEHKIEKDREKQFIKSLIYDLEDDIINLDSLMAFEKRGIDQLDTLIFLLNDPGQARQNGDQLYYTARMGPRYIPFANNTRTFDQLKNSGGFRLIRKVEASNKIMAYYSQFTLLYMLQENYNREFDTYKLIAGKIFDPVTMRNQEGEEGNINRSNYNPSLRSYDSEKLKELGYHALQMNGSRRSKKSMLQNLKKSAVELTLFLKNQYRLN